MRIRQTKQLKIMEEELAKFNAFFTAEDLHKKLLHHDQKTGIATIYRYLKQLVDSGKIHSYSCDRKTLYSTSKQNHCHFRCEHCNTVKHITLRNLNFLEKELAQKICHLQIDIAGICEECARR